jgi:hypothetical protein
MILHEKNDKLKEAYQVAKIHLERMQYAHRKIEECFPLDIPGYEKIDDDALSYFDQFVYRFSKLQDCMGAKLFKSILDNLGEDTRGVPFIDILSRLEVLNIIDRSDDWLSLREIRNVLAHEYPFNQQEIVDGLNLLHNHYKSLIAIWQKLEAYLVSRFGFLV